MSDFELDIELLTFLMESRPKLWDRTDDIRKDRNVTKRLGDKWVLVLKKTLKVPGFDHDNDTKTTYQ
jgi:hypothetical protein